MDKIVRRGLRCQKLDSLRLKNLPRKDRVRHGPVADNRGTQYPPYKLYATQHQRTDESKRLAKPRNRFRRISNR